MIEEHNILNINKLLLSNIIDIDIILNNNNFKHQILKIIDFKP